MTTFACPQRLASRDDGQDARRLVVDCPASAWTQSHQDALADLRVSHGSSKVDAFEGKFNAAAARLIESRLIRAWQDCGYDVVFIESASAFESGATPWPDGTEHYEPSMDEYGQVWDKAADEIGADDLVHEAGLDGEFGLLGLNAQRRSLHHRLDNLAETATSPQAEAQLDGWRAAVDNALTFGQLADLGHQIPKP